MRTPATTVLLAAIIVSGASAQDWKPVPGHIMTRWAKDVKPEQPWPEYPRPQFVRERWLNLNGLWNYSVTPKDADKPGAQAGKVLVPFPIESALSGVGKPLSPDDRLWQWRTFTVPAEWKDQRIVLHCGAVDWKARVVVNGHVIGEHTGGYDPFSFDITDALKDGENELIVSAVDPTDTGGQPRGKQWLTPGGIWYTRTSGIWQTVWMEPVPPVAIKAVHASPDATTGEVVVTVETTAPGEGLGIVLEAKGTRAGEGAVHNSAALHATLKLSTVCPWSPDSPDLYDLDVRLIRNGQTLDTVKTYFAVRDVKMAPDAQGVNRLLLNGKPLFHFGPLDQGFWPEGIYTPPTDEAMKFDIEAVKKMGGNMLRKHVKVEPDRFYYWCDRLGIMVWQDMPSPFFKGKDENSKLPPLSDEWKSNFEHELKALIDTHRDHPSIVMWVPFNEGWGQNDLEWAKGVVNQVKHWDPSRLVNCTSGWTDTGNGDVHDIHDYPGPSSPPTEPHRAAVLGEFGGLGLPVQNHTWVDKNNWGYVSYKDQKELTDAYVGLIDRIPVLIGQGLCAAVYTQTTDCEIECNGWLTYDREVWKIDPDRAAAVTKKLYGPVPTVKTIIATAPTAHATWKYTTDKPADGWFAPDFGDQSWKSGTGSFGTHHTPGAHIGTEWNTSDIWIRRTFDLGVDLNNPRLLIHHDEDAEVYIDGVLAGTFKGYTSAYALEPIAPEAAAKLTKGKHTLAIHCHQTNGGQNIDAGIAELVEGK
ncbi:MAG: beta-galactosidase [Planctomycetes bacterium]|nr:beta-galactosidase [Planctomycetota bacterium]